jgi:hypothetical protein
MHVRHDITESLGYNLASSATASGNVSFLYHVPETLSEVISDELKKREE